MKLVRAERQRRLRVKEVVGESRPSEAVDFEVAKHVPDWVWQEVNDLMNEFIQEPTKRSYIGRYVCSLAVVNLELKDRLRRSEDFKKAAVDLFQYGWPKLGPHHQDEVFALADFLLLFPELRDLRTDIDARFEALIKDVRTHFEIIDFAFWHALTKMLILFPEKQEQILALAQEFKDEILPVGLAADPSDIESVEGVMENNANARLLFPEEAKQILQDIRPYWKTALRSIQQGHPEGYKTFEIFSAYILSAEEALVTADGDLRITPYPPPLHRRSDLPERSIA